MELPLSTAMPSPGAAMSGFSSAPAGPAAGPLPEAAWTTGSPSRSPVAPTAIAFREQCGEWTVPYARAPPPASPPSPAAPTTIMPISTASSATSGAASPAEHPGAPAATTATCAPLASAQSRPCASAAMRPPSAECVTTSSSVAPGAIPDGKAAPRNSPGGAAMTPATLVPWVASPPPWAPPAGACPLQPDRPAQCCRCATLPSSTSLWIPSSSIATLTPLPVSVVAAQAARPRPPGGRSGPTEGPSAGARRRSSPSPILRTLLLAAGSPRRSTGTVAVTNESDCAATMSVAPSSPSSRSTVSLPSRAAARGPRASPGALSTTTMTLRPAGVPGAAGSASQACAIPRRPPSSFAASAPGPGGAGPARRLRVKPRRRAGERGECQAPRHSSHAAARRARHIEL